MAGNNVTANDAVALKLVAVKEVVGAMLAKAAVMEKSASPLIKQLCEDGGEDKPSCIHACVC
jgi:hypothetical protein